MKKNEKVDFAHFLERFPEVELPITLGEDAHLEFSRENDPLAQSMITQFILPMEDGTPDELTEYIACFAIPETHAFHAVVYWRGALLDYQYVLITFTPKGEPIDKAVIGGTISDGASLTRSVVTIDEDWHMLIVSGYLPSENQPYEAASSTARRLELLPDGKIVNI